jgi:SAM-dependent MidA family methyltransferase
MTASSLHSILPSLTPDEKLHSSAATALIVDRVSAADGWLSFDQFMELALYAPGLGYYSAGSIKLGKSGDFVTAPEVSDLFSRCVARQCADILSETGGEILELGAGTGRMAATILQSLADIGVFPDRYGILEVSADLSDRQRTRIEQLPSELRDRVVWLDRLPETPIRGVVLANEVLDALPFQRFVVRADTAHELGVGLGDSGLEWQEKPAPAPSQPDTSSSDPMMSSGPFDAAASLIRDLPSSLPDGYTSELCLRVEPWIAGVGRCLSHGALLLFDYGLPRSHYYHPQRTDGTLRCYFKQRAHDNPFINVGVQDITAWVDFTRVAEAAVGADLEVSGFATQAAFLLGTGIEAMTAEVSDTADRVRLAGEARRLLMPGEMGESFKVMALCRNLQQPLRGFAYQDLRRSL